MAVGSSFTRSSSVLPLLLHLLLQLCFFSNMENITDGHLSIGSLEASPGITVVKMPGFHSETTVRLLRRHSFKKNLCRIYIWHLSP